MIDDGPLPWIRSTDGHTWLAPSADLQAARSVQKQYERAQADHAGIVGDLKERKQVALVQGGRTVWEHIGALELAKKALEAERLDPDPPRPSHLVDGQKPHIHLPVRDWRDPMRKGLRCAFCNVPMSTPRDFERDRLSERLNRMFGGEEAA